MMTFMNFFWRFFDNIILLQMGSTYKARLREFSHISNGGDGLRAIEDWRKEQQAEWDRLSTALALLATMNAAIMAITPHAPNFAYSAWLAAAGLSVCGVFIVQYFPIKAFSITDEDMGALVQHGNPYINTTLLANSVASPVVIALWASILFVAGVIDYIIQADLNGARYKIFAAIPVGFGVASVVMTLVAGEILGRRVDARYGVGAV